MNKYAIFHIDGGCGKSIVATSVVKSLKTAYPEHKLIVITAYPEVFLHNTNVFRVYKFGNIPYFYDDYIKNKDTIVFRHEPYYETQHILKNKHLIENWCKLLDIEYTFQSPFINFNFVQTRNSKKWQREKPILLIQTNGGHLGSGLEYSWTRDIPYIISNQIAEKYKETHHIVQICKPSSLKIKSVRTSPS
jgi:hypothetical protein